MRTTRLTFPALLATVGLLAGACSQDAADAPTIDAVADADNSDVEADPQQAAYRAAVQQTIDAPALTTNAVVRVATSGGVAEVRFEVRRDGDRRELDVTSDQGVIRYVIGPEGATVDTGDGPVDVDGQDVPTVTSLAALADLQNLTFPQKGVAEGTLPATSLDGATDGPVLVTVRYTADGFVDALELRGPDDSYVALLTYRVPT